MNVDSGETLRTYLPLCCTGYLRAVIVSQHVVIYRNQWDDIDTPLRVHDLVLHVCMVGLLALPLF